MGLRSYLASILTLDSPPVPVEAQPVEKAAPSPFQPAGTGGQAYFGGYLQSNEKHPDMAGAARWRNFDDWKRNVTAVGLGLRTSLTLAGLPDWTVEPYKADAAKPTAEDIERARFATRQLHNLRTPWKSVVQVASLAQWDGYALQVWTAKRLADGRIGLLDVEHRPPHTVERWQVDEATGVIEGVVQRSPQTQAEIPIPRSRLAWSRDLPITDSPEGVGILRQLAEAVRKLKALEKLQDRGFEKDINGTPVVFGPILAKRAKIGTVDENGRPYTQADFDREFKGVLDWLGAAVRKDAGLALDSGHYASLDGTVSNAPLWKLEVLSAQATSHAQIAAEIRRLAWEILAMAGLEYLLLGQEGAGSLAMAEAKARGAMRVITSTLNSIAETFRRDLLRPLWVLNGWDPETVPTLTWDALELRDVAAVVQSLSALLTGAGVEPGRADDAVEAILANLGLPPLEERDEADLLLRRQAAADRAGLDRPSKAGSDPDPGDLDLDDEEED